MQGHETSQEFIVTLQFVQNVIARMANMCTVCKICAATAFPAFIVAGTTLKTDMAFILAALFLFASAWIDGRYLFRERNYIAHYQELVEKWNLGTLQKEDMFKLSIGSLKKHRKNTKCSPLLSSSIRPYYGALLLCDGLLWCFLKA